MSYKVQGHLSVNYIFCASTMPLSCDSSQRYNIIILSLFLIVSEQVKNKLHTKRTKNYASWREIFFA